jgi:hypothetical protein
VKAKEISFHPDMNISEENKDEGENFTVLSAVMNAGNTISESCQNNLKAEAKQGSFQMEVKDWLSSLKLKQS